jgi:hypothetical protein
MKTLRKHRMIALTITSKHIALILLNKKAHDINREPFCLIVDDKVTQQM